MMVPCRLLVIEDVQNIADIICHAAADAGFEACSANGATATALYDSFGPQVIVLDLLISGMGELAFLQFLKERSSSARIVIISGCSDAYRKQAEDLAALGGLIIEANMAKPFRINELRGTLERIRQSISPDLKTAP